MKLNFKSILLFIVAVAVLLFTVYAALKVFVPDPIPVVPKVCFEEKCVLVEVADTPNERWKGLMDRESLDKDKGMIFIFEEEERHPFWMKNTLIPLDMIWINSGFEIVQIETAVPCGSDPCPSYGVEAVSLYVVEVNAGFADDNNITPGEMVTIEI